MSSSNQRGRVRRRPVATKEQSRSPWKKIIFIIVLVFTIIVVGAGCGLIGATMQSLPDVAMVKPAASSQIFDVKGNLITTVHADENRLPVKISETPKAIQDAFVATEDIRFYSHHGIDPQGILRAIWTNIAHKGVSEGGSTITQQLARNAFLSQDRTFKRKIQEALLAIEIERKYTKQEILEMYMNQIYFGQGAYGVQAAAHIYFGKDIKDLKLAQVALLAGLPQSPNYYSPFNNLKAGKARQATVLNQMAKYGYISQGEADEAKEADLELLSKPNTASSFNDSGYFVSYIIQVISEKYGDNAIYKDGLKIYTTLDPDMQAAAEEAIKELPTYYSDKNGLQQPQGALIAINPKNGHISAMVGGRGTDSFNRAVMAERQPGSAFKPFVYLAALQKGMTPGTLIEDKEVTYDGWSPQNYSRNFSGRVTMRYAIQHSLNIPAVKVAHEVGMSSVLNLAKRMGISTIVSDGDINDNNLAVALGGMVHGVRPIDMASAFGVLANGGVRVEPTAIVKIVDRNGQVIEESSVTEQRVVDAKDAYVLTNMLQSVMSGGTGTAASIGRPAAGKTGTTDDSKDAWFVGYTPELSTAVWMGDDFGVETLHGITGGTVPAYIWHSFMSKALSGYPVESFTVPPGAAAIAAQGYAPPEGEKKKDDKDKKDGKDKDKDKNKKDGNATDDDKEDLDSGDTPKKEEVKTSKPSKDSKKGKA